ESGTPTGPGSAGGEAKPPLRRGASGAEVSKLQQRLNAHGHEPPLKVNGTFDDETDKAVREFQHSVGLATTGDVDANTWGKLDAERATQEIGATSEATGAHIKEKMDTANEGPYGLDVGIHYSYNFEYECKKAKKPELWKDDYRTGYANPTYFVKQGFMDWRL